MGYVVDFGIVAPDKFDMDKFEEYRRFADECCRMADNALKPEDKAAWLRLANSWLQMLSPKKSASDVSENANWPKPSDEDSQASH